MDYAHLKASNTHCMYMDFGAPPEHRNPVLHLPQKNQNPLPTKTSTIQRSWTASSDVRWPTHLDRTTPAPLQPKRPAIIFQLIGTTIRSSGRAATSAIQAPLQGSDHAHLQLTVFTQIQTLTTSPWLTRADNSHSCIRATDEKRPATSSRSQPIMAKSAPTCRDDHSSSDVPNSSSFADLHPIPSQFQQEVPHPTLASDPSMATCRSITTPPKLIGRNQEDLAITPGKLEQSHQGNWAASTKYVINVDCRFGNHAMYYGLGIGQVATTSGRAHCSTPKFQTKPGDSMSQLDTLNKVAYLTETRE
ncbi:hypothetical protein ACLOJK_022576 [Asimina triloba]